MSNPKLKPCPWCKTAEHLKPGLLDLRLEGVAHWIVCGRCHCSGPEKITPAEAIEAWGIVDESIDQPLTAEWLDEQDWLEPTITLHGWKAWLCGNLFAKAIVTGTSADSVRFELHIRGDLGCTACPTVRDEAVVKLCENPTRSQFLRLREALEGMGE